MIEDIPLSLFVQDKTLKYYYVYMPRHHLANKAGKVYMHRYVASVMIGRPIANDEHVHHKNGDRADNRPENLEVMSATEHAKGHQKLSERVKMQCSCCGADLEIAIYRIKRAITGKFYCSEICYRKDQRTFEVTREELYALVWSMPASRVAELFGVSDSAIGERCKVLGVSKPPRGYWRKVETGSV